MQKITTLKIVEKIYIEVISIKKKIYNEHRFTSINNSAHNKHTE